MVGSSSSKNRFPFPSLFSGDEETNDKRRYGMLLDINLLNCPVCFEGFTTPIYQCDNGHLACASCSKKLRNKCSTCTLPIGNIRCRGVEKMIESIIVQCPNFKYGCKETLFSEDHKTHEEKCRFLQCSCPLPTCDYKGTYNNLFQHFDATHKNEGWISSGSYNNRITYGEQYVVSMHISEKMCVLMETNDSLLFVVQCFDKLFGVCVTVKCIAPFSCEVGEFSYSLSFGYEFTVKSELWVMKKVQVVSFETSEADNIDVFPSSLMRNDGRLKLTVEINKW